MSMGVSRLSLQSSRSARELRSSSTDAFEGSVKGSLRGSFKGSFKDYLYGFLEGLL